MRQLRNEDTKGETLKFLPALEAGQRITCHKDVNLRNHWAICSGASVVTGPWGGLARAPVRSHRRRLGRSPPRGGTNGPMCSQTLQRARCWEERRPLSFSRHLPWREERRTRSSFTRTLDTESLGFRYTSYVHYRTHSHTSSVCWVYTETVSTRQCCTQGETVQ